MKGLLVYVDHMHKTKWHKLALCFIIDSLSASMHFLPGWMYWLLGESGACLLACQFAEEECW